MRSAAAFSVIGEGCEVLATWIQSITIFSTTDSYHVWLIFCTTGRELRLLCSRFFTVTFAVCRLHEVEIQIRI